MSLNIEISIPSINEVLGNVPIFSELNKLQSEIASVSNEFGAALQQASLLGRSQTTINGLQSLTQNYDNDSILSSRTAGIEVNIGAVRITADIPGLTSTLRNTQSNASDMKTLTGRTSLPSTFDPYEILISNSAQSIKSGLNTSVGVTPSFSRVVNSTVQPSSRTAAQSAYGQINAATGKLTEIVNNVASAVNNLQFSINTSIGDISVSFGKLDNVTLQVDNYIEKEIRRLTNNRIADDDLKAAVDAIGSDRAAVAVQIMQPYVTTDFAEFEEAVHAIPSSPTTQIGQPTGQQANIPDGGFGQSTYSPPVIGSDQSAWDGRRTDARAYGFRAVQSQEELVAEFRQTRREITEFVVHWTANFNDQGHIGAKEIHDIMINRTDISFDGCGYHYIIKRDGTIERGRPVGLQGAHAANGGHNRYSIGISFVAGYNCPSGTPNPDRYVGADSITTQQFRSFDRWCQAFYQVWPAGQAFGHNDTDPRRKPDPGFDVGEYVRTKFGKQNIIAAAQGPLTASALAATV